MTLTFFLIFFFFILEKRSHVALFTVASCVYSRDSSPTHFYEVWIFPLDVYMPSEASRFSPQRGSFLKLNFVFESCWPDEGGGLEKLHVYEK